LRNSNQHESGDRRRWKKGLNYLFTASVGAIHGNVKTTMNFARACGECFPVRRCRFAAFSVIPGRCAAPNYGAQLRT
jgi:hypothetical protein